MIGTACARAATAIASLALLFGAAGALAAPETHMPETPTPPGTVYASPIPAHDRRPFYGELHLHTANSFDAWVAGTRLSPADAYAFGRGDIIRVPAYQVARQQGVTADGEVPVRRAWPLDFMAVTDHSESIGIFREMENPDSALARSEIGRRILTAPGGVIQQMFDPHQPLPPELRNEAVVSRAWREEIEAANRFYQPGRFTTFIGYEWTSTVGNDNLHRNVLFNAGDAPPPFTAEQSFRPEDLWTYLEAVRAGGRDVLAIPHNSNVSNGRMFDWATSDGAPIDAVHAWRRRINEPLAEIVQVKGQSDTLPELSPNDEFADFERFELLLGTVTRGKADGSYIRQAYGRGLEIGERVGVNPHRFGLVGATDIHNGLSTSDESAFAGGPNGGIDPATMSPQGDDARRAVGLAPSGQGQNVLALGTVVMGSGGLAGVWAEENTRNSIFAALKRKETFATSGTRIRLRVFGGWHFDRSLLERRDWIRRAYAEGVAMGGEFPRRAGGGAPTFVVEAAKDPDGANLDRVQIVKLWLAGNRYEERIFDVALSGGRRVDAAGAAPPVGNTVDPATGRYANSIGAATLATVWSDPQFDPAVPALYYVRVLEIPTPRWSSLIALRSGLPLPADLPATLQERAWSSPIWYMPAGGR